MYGQKSCGLKIVGQMVFGQNDIGRNVTQQTLSYWPSTGLFRYISGNKGHGRRHSAS